MIIPDINLLVYAYIDGVQEHEMARRWWERTLNQSEAVGLAPLVLFGFVRLTTNRRIFESPLAVAQAVKHTRTWLERPNVQLLSSGPRHVALALELIERSGAAGNLTSDAQLAAHALELDATLATNDLDFARFAGVRKSNPLGRSSTSR